MHCTRVLTLLALLVGLVHSFKWEIVVGGEKRLEFYKNGTLTHIEDIPSAHLITSVTYDPVHYRVLFANSNPNMTILSFDLSTRRIQPLVTVPTYDYYARVVYDPVTQVLFWEQGLGIYSFSINPASPNKAAGGNLIVTLNEYCSDVAVDSCGGYIYWASDKEIERARLDGSEREVIINSVAYYRRSMAIDPRTQKMYWIETIDVNDTYQMSIESANFDGKNRTTLYHAVTNNSIAHSLAVSKDYIYWQNRDQPKFIWQLPKNPSHRVARNFHALPCKDCWSFHRIATNYKIKEQIQGLKGCDALWGLIPNNSNPECTVSICQNYCIEGECIVNAEGQPMCSCKAGYSGERCEVTTCQDYCLNGGICSLNEENKRVCRCTADYEGERCDVPTFLTKCIQAVSILKDMLNADVTSIAVGVKSTCPSTVN